MSVYLFQRLLARGTLPEAALVSALQRSLKEKCSLVEAVLIGDVRAAHAIAACFAQDGDLADPAWRPDSRLLLDLPPGICERFLAFPFRERAGAVEVATVSAGDTAVAEEFSHHLGRPVALFRASLQGLLAAAGARVDLNALASEHPEAGAGGPLPLIRKSRSPSRPRRRTPTSPGIGERSTLQDPASEPFGSDPLASSPVSSSPYSEGAPGSLSRVDQARHGRELAHALAALLPQPYLIFELSREALIPRAASASWEAGGRAVARRDDNVVCLAAHEGKFIGPWKLTAELRPYAAVFSQGEVVRIERIGSAAHGLVVARKMPFDGSDDSELLDRARLAWLKIEERSSFLAP